VGQRAVAAKPTAMQTGTALDALRRTVDKLAAISHAIAARMLADGLPLAFAPGEVAVAALLGQRQALARRRERPLGGRRAEENQAGTDRGPGSRG
jgi:hypothetical protein